MLVLTTYLAEKKMNPITFDDVYRYILWGMGKEEYPHAEKIATYVANKVGAQPVPVSENDPIIIEHYENLDNVVYRELVNIVGEKNIDTALLSRLVNSHGQSYRDLVKYYYNVPIKEVPLAIIYPSNVDQLLGIFDLARQYDLTVLPVGGRTTVTGSLLPFQNTLLVNLKYFNQIEHIDKISHYVVVQCGIYGPELERVLNKHDLTLGHFPQSFEYSTLGGWLATRSAGQSSNFYGKIEDMTLGIEVATPVGVIKVVQNPNTAAGPRMMDLFLGAQGIFGIITKATLRVWQLNRRKRKAQTFFLPNFEEGIKILRDLAQTGIPPAITRLSDEEETAFYLQLQKIEHSEKKSYLVLLKALEVYLKLRHLKKRRSLLILVYDSPLEYARASYALSKKILKKYHAVSVGSDGAASWFRHRFRHPYLRDIMIRKGIMLETMETATTWDNVLKLYNKVKKTASRWFPIILTHISHIYPTGATLYFTFMGAQNHANLDQIAEIHKEISCTFVKNGGTTSHHHGVGTFFRLAYHKEVNPMIINLIRMIKATVDPNNVLAPLNIP